jgi:hypothetical protein
VICPESLHPKVFLVQHASGLVLGKLSCGNAFTKISQSDVIKKGLDGWKRSGYVIFNCGVPGGSRMGGTLVSPFTVGSQSMAGIDFLCNEIVVSWEHSRAMRIYARYLQGEWCRWCS